MVLKGYPRLSETFIAQEIRELERLGFSLELISLRHPTDISVHPIHNEITAPVHYLPEYLHQEPLRVLRAWWKARKMPGYKAARKSFVEDFRRDKTANRIRRFGQGLVIASEFSEDISFLYAHFIHTPTSAARYGAKIAGLEFAISAHAKDIWTTPGWELTEKLNDAAWCATCTRGGAEELYRHASNPKKVKLVYHGIDLSRFTKGPFHKRRDGTKQADPVRFLTVGRAVPKKGIDTIIEALAELPDDLHWHWLHIGSGPLREKFVQQVSSLGLADKCEFKGALAQADVLSAYRQSDLFVLPCRIDETGDRDGLPNVIIEAQSQGLAVLTTALSGIPELIVEGENGIFVEPDNVEQLSARLVGLSRDPKMRNALGRNGNKRVRAMFDHRATIPVLEYLLQQSLDKSQAELTRR